MRPEVEEIYRELDRDMGWLFHKWGEFQELYGKGQDQIDLLNFAASNFFYFSNQLMFESMILHISRLTDPPRTRSQTNLSLASFLDVLDDTEVVLKGKLQSAFDKVQDASKFARRWRHKRIAHTDRYVTALPGFTANDLKHALNAIRDFMSCVEEYYDLPRSVFANDLLWGARSLVRLLRDGIKAQEDKQRHLRKVAKGA